MSDQTLTDPFVRPAIALIGALALALAAMTSWNNSQSRQQVYRMPQGERQQLYEHVLSTMTGACAPIGEQSFDEYCREQAAYIAFFPECDEPCQELRRRVLFRPTK